MQVKLHITEIYEPTKRHFESKVSIYEHLGDNIRYQYYKGVVEGMNLILSDFKREQGEDK